MLVRNFTFNILSAFCEGRSIDRQTDRQTGKKSRKVERRKYGENLNQLDVMTFCLLVSGISRF